jgi:leucyl aminopeptidase
MPLRFADPTSDALPLYLVAADNAERDLAALPAAHRSWAAALGISGALGQSGLLPDGEGGAAGALIGIGDARQRARKRFAVGAAIAALPAGVYRLAAAAAEALDAAGRDELALGYLLSLYRFDRYREQKPAAAALVAPEGVDRARLERIAAGEALTRDLINTPAEDMGPDGLEAAVRDLAGGMGARVAVTVEADALRRAFPLIHTVGRAGARPPRLIDLSWGETGPTLTLIGKGVCFDTGGLNLKPGASMALMKKDMGGAATVLGLAQMIMASALPLRLRVLIPAVENAVSGHAFRPGDIFTARNGMTVEINNTDAEGRLVLADALALADETPADLTICMATLTGAARVALGPDIAPFFTDDEGFAGALMAGAARAADPVWRLPFHDAYEPLIEPGIADLDNAPKGGFAGAITAALFLRRFVPNSPRFAHFDIFGWQPSAAPGRPKGGTGQGARALFEALPEVLAL